MKKETIITAGLVTGAVAGLSYFVYKFVKETKKQLKEMEEVNQAKTQELMETIALRDQQLALAEEHIDTLIFGTPEPPQDENEELEEMRRRRVESSIHEDVLAPSEEEDYHAGAQQTEEEVVHHNVWQENEYFNVGEENIPYHVVEAAKNLKGNEGQSMRHDTDPGSVEAWNQYKSVLISQLYDNSPELCRYVSERYNLGVLFTKENIHGIMDIFSELLEVNDTNIVQPYNEHDANIWEDVRERRRDFFGPDAYYSETFPVTFGEILFEFSQKFEEDTTEGCALAMVGYMLYNSGLLDCETIEQKLLIIGKILEHRNVQNVPNSPMKKLSMFGRVVDHLEPNDTGFDVRLFIEYNEFIGRASDFEEYFKEMNGIDDDEE